MPRYFFKTRDSEEEPDLPDLRAVRSEAIRTAGEMLRDINGAFTGEEWIMEVADEASRLVLTLRFAIVEHGR